MLCKYGCNNEAKYGKCCSDHYNKCPELKRKNSNGQKKNKSYIRWQNYSSCSCIFCKKETKITVIKKHSKVCSLNPINKKLCLHCNVLIIQKDGSNKYRKFCSTKCSNIFHNNHYKPKENHPNWKGGYDAVYRKICFQYYEKKCIICDFDIIIEVHHIDENHENNSPKNLIPLCRNHHGMVHMNKYKKEIKNIIANSL